MTNLRESWERTKEHLRIAYASVGSPTLEEFLHYLDHNELELAADVLADFGDNQEDEVAAGFWQALKDAYENMNLGDKATRCRFRIYEAQHGFVEARLTLTATKDGGRSLPVFTDYRPDWNIGNVTDSSEMTLNGAPITLEEGLSILPGSTGLVRLHPFWPDAWRKIQTGAQIAMHEGRRVVGYALVLRVTLRQ